MQNSFSGISTISCSTRGAPRDGMPTRSAELTPMRTSHLRRRRCGAAGPERRSICGPLSGAAGDVSPTARLLRERHSIRSFDDARPITLAEIARFLDGAARVVSTWESRVDLGDIRPVVAYATRPYPSAGASYELELYLAVDKCDGLARGFYHYDAGGHALVPIDVPHAAARRAVRRGAAFDGRARHAADRHHHRGALRPGVMEIQLARLCADPEGRRVLQFRRSI